MFSPAAFSALLAQVELAHQLDRQILVQLELLGCELLRHTILLLLKHHQLRLTVRHIQGLTRLTRTRQCKIASVHTDSSSVHTPPAEPESQRRGHAFAITRPDPAVDVQTTASRRIL